MPDSSPVEAVAGSDDDDEDAVAVGLSREGADAAAGKAEAPCVADGEVGLECVPLPV